MRLSFIFSKWYSYCYKIILNLFNFQKEKFNIILQKGVDVVFIRRFMFANYFKKLLFDISCFECFEYCKCFKCFECCKYFKYFNCSNQMIEMYRVFLKYLFQKFPRVANVSNIANVEMIQVY